MDVNFKRKEDVDKHFKIAEQMFAEDFSECKRIEQFSTLELIEELRTRKGIEVSSSGWGKKWDLTEKYTNNRDVKSDVLLIVRDLTEL